MRGARFVLVAFATILLTLAPPAIALGAPLTAEEDAPEFVYESSWTAWSSAELSSGSYRFSNVPGAAASIGFSGTAFEIIGRKGPEFGVASVSVDGGAPAKVDFYSVETTMQQSAYAVTGLPDATHTICIEWSGERNPASSGTYIGIDAIRIEGSGFHRPPLRFEEDSTVFAFSGLWSVWRSPVLSGGGYAYGNHPSSAFTLHFAGTALSLIARTGPEFGIADVSIDGGAPFDLDLYSPTTNFRASLPIASGLAPTRHSVSVSYSGRKNPASSGTHVNVDAASIAVVDAPDPGAVTLIESDDAHVSYSGAWRTWSSGSLSGGSYRYANASGASAALTFTGTRLDLVARTGPEFGRASVTIDGIPAGYVDFYAPETRFQQVVFSTWELTDGPHQVVLAWTGTAGSAAVGTSICVDAFRVVGTATSGPIEETDYRIVRLGSWGRWSNPQLSGGSYAYTNSAGGAAVIDFEGDSFSWLTRRGPEFGIASVSIDGGPAVDVDLYNAANEYRSAVFTTALPAAGPHRAVISWTGRRNAAATATYVGLDSVSVNGTLRQAIVRHDQNDPRLGAGNQWAGWASPLLAGGDYAYANAYGTTVNIAFVGTSFDYIARTGPEFGIMTVSLDGGPVVPVDLYSPDTLYQQAVYRTGELPLGEHRLQVRWTGTKNAAAGGTYINLDAFDVAGVLVQAPRPLQVTFNYPWARYLVVDKSDFRIYLVENGNAVVSFPIAHGKVTSPTPNGVWRMGAKYYPDPLSVYGPRKMRLYRQSGSAFVFTAYNIHGTNNPPSIGTRASAGCIRLYNHDILVLFDMVPLGTMVVTQD